MTRRIGEIDSIHGRGTGDHVCWAYTSGHEYRSMLASYLDEGISRGERIAYYGPPAHQVQLVDDLVSRGRDPEALLRDGGLALGTSESAYLPSGRFDPDAAMSSYREMVAGAVADGYDGLRVVGDTTGLLAAPYRAALPGYELRADLLAATAPFTAVCAYDVRGCDVGALQRLRAVHPLGLSTDGRIALHGYHIYGGGSGEIVVAGEIDLLHAPLVEEILVEGAKDAAIPQIDVGGLRFADLHAVRAIAAGARALDARFGEVTIRGARPTFARVWDLLGYNAFSTVEVRA